MVNNDRYFMSTDNSAHDYIVPVTRMGEREAWLGLPEDDEASWGAPEWATRVDGGRLTFTDPRVE